MVIFKRGTMKRWVLGILALIIVLGASLVILRYNEDNWIKDKRGVWVKHGNPKNTPEEVTTQQDMINKAQDLYRKTRTNNIELSNGPCLGVIGTDWVADIVHNPRQDVDNNPDNQCKAYLEGKAHHFIELDTNGNIIRIQ